MSTRTRVLLAALATAASVPLLVSRAEGAVVHEQGFSAVVSGWRSWYGSYGLAGIGASWCVDHGPPAPDAALDYAPTELADQSPATRQAIAWAVGAHGPGADRVGAAALMLVLHDLMGARYPGGPLDVGGLAPPDLRGFEGAEQAVLDRARAIKADAVSRSHLRSPLRLDVEVRPVPPGQPGSVVARVRDAAGAAVAHVPLRVTAAGAVLTGAPDAVTGPDGGHAFPFTAVAGANRFEVTSVVPDLVLQSFAPRRARAQRVARPARLSLRSATGFAAAPPRRLKIRKRGDAEAYLSVAGARFEVSPVTGGPPVGTLVTAADGTTGTLELPAGRYQVREEQAPPGYATAGPWAADLTKGDVELEVADRARPGRARLTKVDAVTGRLLGGARLQVSYDADRDGAFETHLPPVTTTEVATELEGLRPGDYQVTEISPPPGYERLAAPVPFSVAPGETATVRIADVPVPVAPPPPPPVPPEAAPPAPPPAADASAPPRPTAALARTGAAAGQQAAVGAALLAGGALLTVGARVVAPRRRARHTSSPDVP